MLKSQFVNFYTNSGLDYLYLNTADKKNYFKQLKHNASLDLSWAHFIQHDQASKITQALSGQSLPPVFLSSIGANSTRKKPDTCYIKDNRIYGDKFYVSGLNMVDYAVIYVENQDIDDISNVFIPKSMFDYNINTFRPIGMENTVTGTMKFTGQPIDPSQILISKKNPKFFAKENFMDLAFPTNCIGLCFGLCNDIEQFINNNQLNDVDSEFKKLKLELYSYEQVWLHMLDTMIDAPADFDYYNHSFLLYNNGKKMLNALCKFILDNGTGYFCQINANSQRYRDALIYTTHMHNYRVSTREFFRHRSNGQ
jgi:hypothetical protein